MTWWQAAILGIVQGLTEFLPISSDGHLALAQNILQLKDVPLTFDIFVHAGTLLVMIIFFWKNLRSLSRVMWLRIAIATIPVVIAGLLFRDALETLKYNKSVLGVSFFFTATLLLIADQLFGRNPVELPHFMKRIFSPLKQWWDQKFEEPTLLQAFCIGLLQSLAILPGVSRSGSTLAGGAIVGLPREKAFPFAFVVGIPAITGAVLYDLIDLSVGGHFASVPWDKYLFATFMAALAGFIALKILQFVMFHSRLLWFSLYCFIVSILTVLLF